MCECYQVGGRFIAEDPDCEVHGQHFQKSELPSIQFFDRATGEVFDRETSDVKYFVMVDKVFRDNFRSCESQCNPVSFDNFIEECPEVGWRII